MKEKLASLGITLDGEEEDWPDKLLSNLEEALFEHIGEEELQRWLNERTMKLQWKGKGSGDEELKEYTYLGWIKIGIVVDKDN